MPQAVAAFLTLLVALGPAATPPPPPRVTLARFEVTISTSSNWSSVRFNRGRIVVQQEVTLPADVKLTSTPSGWDITAPGRVARTVAIRGVFEDTSATSSFRLSVRKSWFGRTTVDVRNTTSTPFSAAHLANTRVTAPVGRARGPVALLWRTRAQLFGTKPVVLPRADTGRKVLAAYYGWFQPADYDSPKLSDRPQLPYSSQKYPGILELTKQARSNGIDGFVVSYEGPNSEGIFANVLAAAEATGNVAAPYLEIHAAVADAGEKGPTQPAVVLDWLRAVLDRADSPAFLRSGGEPVVFVYQMQRIGAAGWRRIRDALAQEGKSVRLAGDAPLDRYSDVQWGVHSYNPNFTDPATLKRAQRAAMLEARLLAPPIAGGPHLYAATVSPGFDDRPLRGEENPLVERGPNGERYLATWEAALASEPDWVLVTTWNEWFEGTSVQPGEIAGDLSLRQTATLAERFRAGG